MVLSLYAWCRLGFLDVYGADAKASISTRAVPQSATSTFIAAELELAGHRWPWLYCFGDADIVQEYSKRCSPVPDQRLARIRRVGGRTRRPPSIPLTVPLEEIELGLRRD